jgi:hypothetical protein
MANAIQREQMCRIPCSYLELEEIGRVVLSIVQTVSDLFFFPCDNSSPLDCSRDVKNFSVFPYQLYWSSIDRCCVTETDQIFLQARPSLLRLPGILNRQMRWTALTAKHNGSSRQVEPLGTADI